MGQGGYAPLQHLPPHKVVHPLIASSHTHHSPVNHASMRQLTSLCALDSRVQEGFTQQTSVSQVTQLLVHKGARQNCVSWYTPCIVLIPSFSEADHSLHCGNMHNVPQHALREPPWQCTPALVLLYNGDVYCTVQHSQQGIVHAIVKYSSSGTVHCMVQCPKADTVYERGAPAESCGFGPRVRVGPPQGGHSSSHCCQSKIRCFCQQPLQNRLPTACCTYNTDTNVLYVPLEALEEASAASEGGTIIMCR